MSLTRSIAAQRRAVGIAVAALLVSLSLFGVFAPPSSAETTRFAGKLKSSSQSHALPPSKGAVHALLSFSRAPEAEVTAWSGTAQIGWARGASPVSLDVDAPAGPMTLRVTGLGTVHPSAKYELTVTWTPRPTSSSSSSSSTSTSTSSSVVPPVAGVVDVPVSVVADCSRAVDAELSRFLAGVVNGSTVRFQPGGCYGHDATILIQDRADLTLDGQGATFKALTRGTSSRASFKVRGGTNITLRNMTVRGANPTAGITPTAYDSTVEYQHGYSIDGAHGVLLDNVAAYDVYGDFVEAQPDWRYDADPNRLIPARNVVVRNARFERNGRMGIGLTHVVGFTLENSYLGEINMAAIDLETDLASEYLQDIRILNNTFGRHRHAMVAGWGHSWSPNHGPVTITANTQTGHPITCEAPITVKPLASFPTSAYRDNWTITDNHFITASDGVYLLKSRRAYIARNTVEHRPDGCGRLAGVVLQDSHTFTIEHNTFHGATQLLRADTTSTNITTTTNTITARLP